MKNQDFNKNFNKIINEPLINRNNFRPIFKDFSGKKIGFVVMKGNVGDFLIEDSAVQLFRHFNIDFSFINFHDNPERFNEKTCKYVEEFVVNGGGNMGELYKFDQELRKRLFSYKKPITVLPQTFTHSKENLDYKRVWVREKESLRFRPDAILAPDLSLGYEFNGLIPKPSEEVGIFLRSDKEKTIYYNEKSIGDPVLFCKTPEEYILLAAKYKKIVTNRLHFAIAGLISHREVILLPNSYFKNKSMYESYLKYLGCKWNPFF